VVTREEWKEMVKARRVRRSVGRDAAGGVGRDERGGAMTDDEIRRRAQARLADRTWHRLQELR
jgi:hypothetical protein